jgi:enoyl-CoA hydratase
LFVLNIWLLFEANLRQMSNELEIYTHGAATVVQFARPEIRSPLSVSTVLRLFGLVTGLGADRAVDKVIFTGIADVFASGADLREIAAVAEADAAEFAIRGQSLMGAIANLPQTTISAINGYCFGGAIDLAIACDRRIASPKAIFSHPGVGLGIITGWGGTQRLPRVVGEAFALEMLLTARRVAATEALQRGLIDGIADDPLAAALTV